MKKHTGRSSGSILSYLIWGILFGVLLFCSLSLILGLLAYLGSDPTSLTGIFSAIALILSFFGMGMFVCLRRGEGGALLTLLCSLIIVGVLLTAELIIKRGSISVPFLLNCVCSVASSMLAPAITRKRGRGHRRYK